MTISSEYRVYGGAFEYLWDLNIYSQWRAGPNWYNTAYQGTRYLYDVNIKGEWLKYQLPQTIRLYKFIIISTGQGPSSFKIVGSNDNINWTNILYTGSYTGIRYTGTITSPGGNNNYIYYAIIIQSTTSTSGDYTLGISDFRLYGTLM